MFNVPHFQSAVSQKTFFKGDKVQLKWNNHGTALIVLAQTDVDKTGRSYYGETTLYLLSANGGFDSRIDLGMYIEQPSQDQRVDHIKTRRVPSMMYHGHPIASLSL